MTSDNRSNALFPAFLKGPSALLWTVAVPMVLLAAADAFVCWLTWSELAKPVNVWWLSKTLTVEPRWLLAALALAALAPAVVAAAVACRRKEPPTWVAVALGFWCGTFFLAFVFSGWGSWMTSVPQWVVNPISLLFAQLTGVTPAVFLGIWRLAGWQRRDAVSAGRDIGFSCLAVVVPVVTMYFWVNLLAGVGSRCSSGTVFVLGLVLLFVTMFLGLFRCLMWLRLWLANKIQRNRIQRSLYAVLVALVFPLCGLLLNRKIPFPADLQNGWAYALTLANALFLIMPPTRARLLDACARAGRLMLFPFTLYFFVVFLPFLPFAIPAILAVGAGFLLLTPVLLFAFHLQALADDRAVARTEGSRVRKACRMAFCVAVLPVAFALQTELDRVALHRALQMVFQPDYGNDLRLGVPRVAVRRALVNAQRFKTGREYPLLSRWVNWRVFDNLLLQDAKLNTLWGLFFGGEIPAAEELARGRNDFASLWGGRTRNVSGRAARPLPDQVRVDNVASAFSLTNGEVETRVTLTLRGDGAETPQEFRTTVTVPPGVWVSGLRLKIGDEWVHGDIIERKAADWVYRQITRVERRDPALLRYEDNSRLSLSVFPVESHQKREVELVFLCPEGYADAVVIGDRRVALGDGTLKPQCVWANGVLVKNRLWRGAPADGAGDHQSDWLVLDCSETNGTWTGEALAVAARGMTGTVHVVWANAETVTEHVSAERVAEWRPRLNPVGGLNVGAALRRVARCCRLDGVTRPRVALAGRTIRSALEKVSPETWRGVLAEAPGLRELRLSDGSSFPVPGAVQGAVSVLAAGGDLRQTVDAADEVLAFEGSASGPQTSNEEPLAGWVRLPPESKWVRGATAWRLQRELDAHPDRDGLRRAILRASVASDVLTAAGAYIVVENDMQRKMLHVKQVQTLGGSGALDLMDSPASDGWLLAVVLVVWLAGRLLPARWRRAIWR